MRRLALWIFPLLALLIIPAGCAHTQPSANAPVVRVRIMAAQQQVMVSASAPPTFKSSAASEIRSLNFPPNAAIPISFSQAGWRIGSATFAPGELLIAPANIGSVNINGAAYRGRYRLVPVSADRFDVINDVDVDSYLMSVVPREMLRDWHPEAYRAQAIVARTYAMYEVHTMGIGKPFDLYDDTKSQVYGGLASESEKSRAAVLETGGEVLAWGPPGHEKIFKAYFSSCCGGIGQSAADAFGDPDIPPLRAKNVGNLCSASPRFSWGPIIIRKDELARRIRSWGAKKGRPEKDLGNLVRIDIAATNQFGRPVRFFLTDSKNLQYSVSGEELRWACNSDANGGPTLLSSFCKPTDAGDSIRFDGHGWGHGVGMCQWDAEELAEQGKPHEYIVRFSYPGAIIARAY